MCFFYHSVAPYRSLSPKSKDARLKKEKDIKAEEEDEKKKKKVCVYLYICFCRLFFLWTII